MLSVDEGKTHLGVCLLLKCCLIGPSMFESQGCCKVSREEGAPGCRSWKWQSSICSLLTPQRADMQKCVFFTTHFLSGTRSYFSRAWPFSVQTSVMQIVSRHLESWTFTALHACSVDRHEVASKASWRQCESFSNPPSSLFKCDLLHCVN